MAHLRLIVSARYIEKEGVLGSYLTESHDYALKHCCNMLTLYCLLSIILNLSHTSGMVITECINRLWMDLGITQATQFTWGYLDRASPAEVDQSTCPKKHRR